MILTCNKWRLGEAALAVLVFSFNSLSAGPGSFTPSAPAVSASREGTAPQSKPLPAATDLRPLFDQWGLTRSRQGDRPTCSVFTMVGSLEFASAKRQGHCPRLSVEFLNWASNQVSGQRNDGGFFSDLWSGFTQYGIGMAEDVPYQQKFESSLRLSPQTLAEAKTRLALGLRLHWIKEWNVRTGLSDAQLLAVRNTLSAGWPVCGGFRWPKQEQWTDGVLQMCPNDRVRDGHSVLLVGYRESATQPGGGVFVFRNTSQEGQDGFMPYAYAQAFMNDAAWIE